MESIVSNRKECFRCGKTGVLHRHHVYGGSRRKWSEEYGCWIYLCPEHHNMSDQGIHFDKEFDSRVKELTEMMWLDHNMASVDDFRAVFGKNYIQDERIIEGYNKQAENAK